MKEFMKRSSVVAQLVGVFATTFTVTASEYCNYGCRKGFYPVFTDGYKTPENSRSRLANRLRIRGL